MSAGDEYREVRERELAFEAYESAVFEYQNAKKSELAGIAFYSAADAKEPHAKEAPGELLADEAEKSALAAFYFASAGKEYMSTGHAYLENEDLTSARKAFSFAGGAYHRASISSSHARKDLFASFYDNLSAKAGSLEGGAYHESIGHDHWNVGESEEAFVAFSFAKLAYERAEIITEQVLEPCVLATKISEEASNDNRSFYEHAYIKKAELTAKVTEAREFAVNAYKEARNQRLTDNAYELLGHAFLNKKMFVEAFMAYSFAKYAYLNAKEDGLASRAQKSAVEAHEKASGRKLTVKFNANAYHLLGKEFYKEEMFAEASMAYEVAGDAYKEAQEFKLAEEVDQLANEALCKSTEARRLNDDDLAIKPAFGTARLLELVRMT